MLMTGGIVLLSIIFLSDDAKVRCNSLSIYILKSVLTSLHEGQLIGHRGVVKLPEGYEYRDKDCLCQSPEIGLIQNHLQAGVYNNNTLILLNSTKMNPQETRDASKAAGRFAIQFQELDDDLAERRRETQSRGRAHPPHFPTRLSSPAHRSLPTFHFKESRMLDPPAENRQNVPLLDIQLERATPSTRLVPVERVKVTIR